MPLVPRPLHRAASAAQAAASTAASPKVRQVLPRTVRNLPLPGIDSTHDPTPGLRLYNSQEDMLGSPYAASGPAVFTDARWKAHKNTGRYWRHLSGLFRSRTAQALTQPLACIACTSTLLCSYEQLVLDHVLPSWFLPLSASGFPVDQTSYARWMEALLMWSDVHTKCTDLVQDAASWVGNTRLRQLVVDWSTAFCHSLEESVKPGGQLRFHLKQLLGPESVDQLMQAQELGRGPQFCLQVLTEVVQTAQLGGSKEAQMLNVITQMNGMISTSERLLDFPIPLSYTRHTSRFLLLWLALLPVALWNELGWLTVVANVIMGYLLLGIEEIGVQIEEPFSMLPLAEMNSELAKHLTHTVASRFDAKQLVMRHLREGGPAVAAVGQHAAKATSTSAAEQQSADAAPAVKQHLRGAWAAGRSRG